MRILTWNIFWRTNISNRWNGLKSHNEILDHLGADIINFQGVATYTRSSNVTPLKAEEGLTIVSGDAELSESDEQQHHTTTGKLLLSREKKSLDSE
ncbi:hypothetical protein MPER_07890, partial [Moniliophthora perniciosa FA553]